MWIEEYNAITFSYNEFFFTRIYIRCAYISENDIIKVFNFKHESRFCSINK